MFIHTMTWVALLVFDAGLVHASKRPTDTGLLIVVAMVVVVEVALLRVATQLRQDGAPVTRLSVLHACALSVVGNIAGFATFAGCILLLRRLNE